MSLRRASHLAWRRILDETVVLDLRRRRAHAVNAAGARILEWLERPRSWEALLARLPEEKVSEGEAFLELVLDEGLVEECEDPETSGETTSSDRFGGDVPRLLWSESLPRLAQQASPPMEIGNRQCVQ